jgi:hypothetical protein
MDFKGLAPKVNEIFDKISKLDCIKEYTLIGGTALSLQLYKRLSEDLDFCKWTTSPKNKEKLEVNWPGIKKELEEKIGPIDKVDVLGFDQVNFEVKGVKLSFYANNHNTSPITTPVHIHNNIKAADVETIGAMKMEVMLRRSTFRDYYDLNSIIGSGKHLNSMIDKASKYSGGLIKPANIRAFISNGANFTKEANFSLLQPKVDVSPEQIAQNIVQTLKKENPLDLSEAIYKNNYKKVKEIVNREPGIVSEKHLKLLADMKNDKLPISPEIERFIGQQVKQEQNKNIHNPKDKGISL